MKMRILAVSAVVVVMLTNGVHAQHEVETHSDFQKGWTEEQLEVWRVIEEWNNAFEANDSESYFEYIDPGVTVLTPPNPYRIEGLPIDRREYEFGIARGYSKVAFFQELQPHVFVHGDMAYATYFNRGWYDPDDGGAMAYLKETNVLIKRDGHWKIVHIHVSATR